MRAKRGKYLSLIITVKTSSTQVYVKTDQEPVEKKKARLAHNCFNRFGSFTKCHASGLWHLFTMVV